jgi:predicted  nucleic acid-binding Zn-ribbon protein
MNIEIKNISGIINGSANIHSGINTVQASNWQGKSSFIRAIETGFGTEKTLTVGKDKGSVSIDTNDETYTVHLKKQNNNIIRNGNPVIDNDYDQLLADLFAFLGEENEVRQAIRDDENLEKLLTRPLEMEDLETRIQELNNEQKSIQAEIQREKNKANKLSSLKQQQNTIESTLAELNSQLTKFENEMSSDKRTKLSELRAERNRVSDLIDRLQNTLSRSRKKLSEAHEEYEHIEIADSSDIESKLVEVHEEYERAQEDKELLQSIYSANKRLLEENRLDLLSDIERGLMDDKYTCWLCSSETTVDEMENQLDGIGDKVLDLREEVTTYQDRIDELETERDEIKKQQRRRDDLEDQISELERTISERDENLSSAKERFDTIKDKIDELDDEVSGTDAEISDIQSEIKYKEAKPVQLCDESLLQVYLRQDSD